MINYLNQGAPEFINTTQRALNAPVNVGSISEKLDQLMPSIYIIVATLGAFLILLIILTKLFYKPVKKMVKNRQSFIQKNIDDSIHARKKAMSLEQEARNKLNASKLISSEIINKSKIEGEMIKNQYISESKLEASKILNKAKTDIKNKKLALEKDLHDEIVNVAVAISEKIIKEKISKEEAEKYCQEYLGKK